LITNFPTTGNYNAVPSRESYEATAVTVFSSKNQKSRGMDTQHVGNGLTCLQ